VSTVLFQGSSARAARQARSLIVVLEELEQGDQILAKQGGLEALEPLKLIVEG
jgi:hypothetical protein